VCQGNSPLSKSGHDNTIIIVIETINCLVDTRLLLDDLMMLNQARFAAIYTNII
jgi:hypothetical protein